MNLHTYRNLHTLAAAHSVLDKAEETNRRFLDAAFPPSSFDEAVALNQAVEDFMVERAQLKAEDARDQAIDAFMVERDLLKAKNARLVRSVLDVCTAWGDELDTLRTEVRRVSDKVARQRRALNGRNRQIADQDATLLQAATFVAQARELLGRIGITVETEDDGRPSLSIELDELMMATEYPELLK